jgi:SAM-dependent methyltransferase
VSVRDRLKRYPRVYWSARKARAAAMGMLPPKAFAGVPGRIHRNDTMIPKLTAEHALGYNNSGAQAAGLVAGAAPSAAEVLDLGCGYGRVLRQLKLRYPDARFTACDIEPGAARFCASEFGAVPVISQERLDLVAFPTAPYDLIWMGSLLTHLDAAANENVLGVLARLVRPDAVLTFTTHGPDLVPEMERYGPGLGDRIDEVQAAMAGGFAYVSYPHYADGSYGISFHEPAYVDAIVAAAFGSSERVAYAPRGWGGHQDFHAFRVAPRP